MMFNVMIADDEYFIRQRLKKIIPFKEWNLNFIGEAENGLEVLDLLEQTKVDIILLDIKMPKMTGIEVAPIIHKKHPNTKVIFLTGYNDFEYLREALKSAAFDYLLKPVDVENLKVVFRECVETLEEDHKTTYQIEKYQHYEKCIELTNVLRKQSDFEELLRKYPDYLSYHYSLYIGIYTMDNTSTIISLLKEKMITCNMECEYMQESEHTYVLQLFVSTKDSLTGLGSTLMNFLKGCHVYTFLTLNNVFNIREDWMPYYKRAIDCLDQRFFCPNTDIFIESTPGDTLASNVPLLKIRQTLTQYLSVNDITGFEEFIKELFEDIIEKHHVDFMRLTLLEVFVTYHLYYTIQLPTTGNIHDYVFSLLLEEYHLEAVKEQVIYHGKQCISNQQILPSDIHLSNKIKDYIDSNYKKYDLSVSMISSVFNLNASYMGTVFKGVNNLSILQYITKVRMDHAKRLLKENQLLVSEVADLTGYSDVYYFSKRFKKEVGISPKEYALQKSIYNSF